MTTDVYVWHRAMLAGEKPPTYSTPEAGWYLHKGFYGMVPASIYWEGPIDPETGELVGDEVLRCEIGGVQNDPVEAWTWIAKRPISRAEYDERMARMITGEELTDAF